MFTHYIGNKDYQNDLSLATQCSHAIQQADKFEPNFPQVLKHLNTALELTASKGAHPSLCLCLSV